MLALYLTYIDDEDDKRIFEKIYREHEQQMYLCALAILHDENDAEDVVQEVFTNIAKRYMSTIKSIENPMHMRNYLLKAAKHTAINWSRKEKKEALVVDEDVLEYKARNMNNDAFLDYICTKMEYETVKEAIETLDKKYHDVLYCHLILGLPIKQVAELLKQSVSATKQQLVRGKKKLIELLRAEGEE